MRVIYFDTETTGLNCASCKVIELAMYVVDDGRVIEEYDRFINVGEPLPPKITQITGISDEMLKREGLDERTVARDLKERLETASVMVAHNAQFDLSFIYYLLKRHYPGEADGLVEGIKWIDTLSVFKDRKAYPHKLCDAVEYYEIEKVNFHRAIDDTKALYEVTQELKKERDDLKEYVNVFGYNPKYGVSGVRFSFIEYKAQPFNYRITPDDKILPRR